jgi:hypothetical protein
LPEPYYYVRFRWWDGLSIDGTVEELGRAFTVRRIKVISDPKELSLYRDDREEVIVRADSLGALLSPYRVVLYQKEHRRFTARDMELRARILELYPKNTPTPFPMLWSTEPEFEVEEGR